MSDLRTDPAVFQANLEKHTLDSKFTHGFAVVLADKTTHFWGNFADVSARFDFVLGGEEAQRVEIAVLQHQRTERYLAAARKRREQTAVSWAHRQTDRMGRRTGTGDMVLRMVEQGDLERAEKVMARA